MNEDLMAIAQKLSDDQQSEPAWAPCPYCGAQRFKYEKTWTLNEAGELKLNRCGQCPKKDKGIGVEPTNNQGDTDV